jgi:hypothetical protein
MLDFGEMLRSVAAEPARQLDIGSRAGALEPRRNGVRPPMLELLFSRQRRPVEQQSSCAHQEHAALQRRRPTVRVSLTSSPVGSTYRIYRSDDNFVSQIRRLVPYLQVDRYDVLIGGTASEPNVVLTIGPMDAETDAEFRPRVIQYLDT